MKQKILILIAVLSFAAVVNAQEAKKMYIMKKGAVINYPAAGEGIAVTDIDSIIFYNPVQPELPQVKMRPLISDVENAGSKFRVAAEIYVKGVTDSYGQGAGITAQVGYGVHGVEPTSWTTWTTAYYVGDALNNDVYAATLTAPVAGNYDIAMRFTVDATTYYADAAGSVVYDPAKAIVLRTFAGQDANIHWCNTQWPTFLSASPNATSGNTGSPETPTTSVIYGRLYYPGITDQAGSSSSVQAQLGIGYGNPLTDDWTWTQANFNIRVDNNHEYMAPFTAPSSPGTYSYVFRFRVGAGWTYANISEGTLDGNFDPAPGKCGSLNVNNY